MWETGNAYVTFSIVWWRSVWGWRIRGMKWKVRSVIFKLLWNSHACIQGCAGFGLHTFSAGMLPRNLCLFPFDWLCVTCVLPLVNFTSSSKNKEWSGPGVGVEEPGTPPKKKKKIDN
jgi:hypothetical protein